MYITYADVIRNLVGSGAKIIIKDSTYEGIKVEGAVKPDKATVDAEMNKLIIGQAKTNKLTEIGIKFTNDMDALVAGYPEREISSWVQQEKEARAYLADNTTPTPLLDALSTARGIDKTLLAQKIVTKADAYATAVGALIGKRQALEDQINAATTVEEIESIVWE